MKSKGVNQSFYGPPFQPRAMMGAMRVGQRIRALRKAKGLDQGELARLAKVKQSTLSDLERGDSKMPRGDTLVRIAAALQVDHDWLMTGEGLPTPRPQPKLDESHILEIYRALSPDNRAALLAAARALLGSQPPPPNDGDGLRQGKPKH